MLKAGGEESELALRCRELCGMPNPEGDEGATQAVDPSSTSSPESSGGP